MQLQQLLDRPHVETLCRRRAAVRSRLHQRLQMQCLHSLEATLLAGHPDHAWARRVGAMRQLLHHDGREAVQAVGEGGATLQ